MGNSRKQVTLTAIVAEPKERWDILFEKALRQIKTKPSRIRYSNRLSRIAI